MTVNLFFISSAFSVTVVDRRLSFRPGVIASDRAKKVLRIACPDASLIAAFNGFAGTKIDNNPLNWLENTKGLGNMRFIDLTEKIRDVLDAGLKGKPRDIARLSLTLAGYWQHRPVLCHISNYETLEKNVRNKELASEVFSIQFFSHDFIFAQTGYYPEDREVTLKKKFAKLRECGASCDQIKKELLKAARDVPFTGDRTGLVGPNCHCVTLMPNGSSTCTLEMIGGSSVMEFPSLISGGSQFTEVMVGTGGEHGPPWGHPETRHNVMLKERRCSNPKCQGRVPDGQDRCATCGQKQIQNQSYNRHPKKGRVTVIRVY